jgi:peroxiredoxin
MKKNILLIITALLIFSCNNKSSSGKFTLTGELKNAPDQKIYLEELFFSQKAPEVLDTADLVNGKFTATAIGAEQGLYRVRLEKGTTGFIFINDNSQINFTADLNKMDLNGPTFSTAANGLMKNFMISMDGKRTTLMTQSAKLDTMKAQKAADSLLSIESEIFEGLSSSYKNYIIQYIDTVSNPVMALFALGYTRGIDPMQLQKPVSGLATRFPKHQAIATIVAQYNEMLVKMQQQNEAKKGMPQVGSMAPDITMNDTNDKPFSLSQLRGKYVLVDFWASWCMPCRGENPNVVAAYNKYKDKNFTVLGVSLDDDKASWLKAIGDDKLTWKHISDLKKWNSAAVPLYGFDGIPYNVLIDPQGKIIAISLREEALQTKLAELLK